MGESEVWGESEKEQARVKVSCRERRKCRAGRKGERESEIEQARGMSPKLT